MQFRVAILVPDVSSWSPQQNPPAPCETVYSYNVNKFSRLPARYLRKKCTQSFFRHPMPHRGHSHGGGHGHSHSDGHGHSHGGAPCSGHADAPTFGDEHFDYKSVLPGLLVDRMRVPSELIEDAKIIRKTEKAKQEAKKLQKDLKKTQKKLKKQNEKEKGEGDESKSTDHTKKKKLAKKKEKIKKKVDNLSEIITTNEEELHDMRKSAGYYVLSQAQQITQVAVQLHFRQQDVLPEVVTLAAGFEYFSHVMNNGFSGWIYLTDAGTSDEPIEVLRRALTTLGATENLKLLNQAVEHMKTLPQDKLKAYQDDERICEPSCCDDQTSEDGCPKFKEILDLYSKDMVKLMDEEGDEDDQERSKKKKKKKPQKKKKKDKEKPAECLEALLIDYALRVATDPSLSVPEPEQDELPADADSLNILTPSWWPSSLPLIKPIAQRPGPDSSGAGQTATVETQLPSSATLLSGLRRAAASSGFAFITVGRPAAKPAAGPEADAAPSQEAKQTTSKSDSTKKKKKGKKKGKKKETSQSEGKEVVTPSPASDAHPLPSKLLAADDIFGDSEDAGVPNRMPVPETEPFWGITSRGPVVCQIFLAPRDPKPWEMWALEAGKLPGNEGESEGDISFFERMAVFISEDGSEVVGTGVMDDEADDLEEDDEDEDEESDEDNDDEESDEEGSENDDESA
eukprot:g642.t1